MFFYSEPDSGGSSQLFTSWTELQKLTASDKQPQDFFGERVSISGDGLIMAVSAFREDANGVSDAGSVYIFQKSGSYWAEVQKLTISDKSQNDELGGNSISINYDGSIIIIGSNKPAEQYAGAVYVFERNGLSWIQTQKLVASDRESYDIFSISSAISNDGSTIVVGAPYEDPNGVGGAGSVYVFEKTGPEWTQIQKMTGNFTGGAFGISVSLSEDETTMAIGASSEDIGKGAVYVYQKSGSVWTKIQRLVPSDINNYDTFGNKCSINSDGSVIVASAQSHTVSGYKQAGAAYVFEKQESTWVETQQITESEPKQGNYFAENISMSKNGTTIALSSANEDPEGIIDAGCVYLFQKINSTWTQVQKLTASDKEAYDKFGRSIYVNSDASIVAIGVIYENPSAISNAGSVYVFQGS